jgi:hypothetical protein
MLDGDRVLAMARYREVLGEFPEDPVAGELLARLSSLDAAQRRAPIQAAS